MADRITFSRTVVEGVNVVLCALPDGTKIGAYFKRGVSVDFDGDPRSYGSYLNCSTDADAAQKQMQRLGTTACHNVLPLDGNGSAGWKNAAGNRELYDSMRANYDAYEALKTRSEDQSLTDAQREEAKKGAAAKKGARDTAVSRKVNEPFDASRAYWVWYGLKALRPGTEHNYSFTEADGTVRNPKLLDDRPALVDANGNVPVVQSRFEPLPGYFVSTLATPLNTSYPEWDQRRWLYPGSTSLAYYVVLGGKIGSATGGTEKRDSGWCISIDSGANSFFRYLDWKNSVGEMSASLYQWLGGKFTDYSKAYVDAVDNEDMRVLYVACPKTNTAAKTESLDSDTLASSVFQRLRKFKAAENSDDLPQILAFLSTATANQNPITLWQQWKQTSPNALASSITNYDRILAGLVGAGFI